MEDYSCDPNKVHLPHRNTHSRPVSGCESRRSLTQTVAESFYKAPRVGLMVGFIVPGLLHGLLLMGEGVRGWRGGRVEGWSGSLYSFPQPGAPPDFCH